jgi:hypothetical protein
VQVEGIDTQVAFRVVLGKVPKGQKVKAMLVFFGGNGEHMDGLIYR